jgi:myo-inositol 2-dehydrogenase/D-chiro-inositol 1-dehydrogenase
MILLATLLILPLALAGPALGFPWTIYFAYVIPPVLVLFAVLQVLRLAIRKEPATTPARGQEGQAAGRGHAEQ